MCFPYVHHCIPYIRMFSAYVSPASSLTKPTAQAPARAAKGVVQVSRVGDGAGESWLNYREVATISPLFSI